MKEELDKLRGAELSEVIELLQQDENTYRLVEVHPPENRQGQRRPGQGSRRFINAVRQEDAAEFVIYYCYERYDDD